jgi:prevent-host-death family protein
MRVFTSRAFNQDVSEAKRIARGEPVIVTDRGRPTHVLLGIDAYRRLTAPRDTIIDLLAAPAPAGADPAAAALRADATWREG